MQQLAFLLRFRNNEKQVFCSIADATWCLFLFLHHMHRFLSQPMQLGANRSAAPDHGVEKLKGAPFALKSSAA
ncbi:MAG: hypothetical protein WA635_07915 [Gallionella sp.]